MKLTVLLQEEQEDTSHGNGVAETSEDEDMDDVPQVITQLYTLQLTVRE